MYRNFVQNINYRTSFQGNTSPVSVKGTKGASGTDIVSNMDPQSTLNVLLHKEDVSV